MTTTALDLGRTRSESRGWTRYLPSVGGLGLVAGLIAIMASPASDDTGETAAEVVAFAQTHDGWLTAIILFAIASIALGGAFVAGLYGRLQGTATATESALVLVGGTLFTFCFALCWTMWTAPLMDISGDETIALTEAQSYLSYDDIGWFVLGLGGVAAAVMAVPASFAAMRAGLPAWLGWLGVVAGIGSIATVAFFGMFAWLAWIAVASIVLALDRSARV
jgi:hypothetical protein